MTVSAWIAYEQWIAPLILKSPLWVPLEKAKIKITWKATLSDEKQQRPLSSHIRRRTDSISDQSSTSTASNTSSLDILHMLHQSRKPISNLISGIRSLNTPEIRDQHSFDRERQAAHSEGVDHEQPRNQWKRKARMVSTVRSATKIFWQGTSHTVPRTSSPALVRMSDLHVPRPLGYHTSSPNRLSFNEPQYFSFQYGSIQDLAYSPDGSKLAATR